MGTLSDKLRHLQETKDLLTLAINKVLYTRGEAPMDDSSSFRDFAAQLFSPEYLYVDGEQGSGWKGLDGVFSDAAGTTPATLGDPVAVVSDDLIEDGEWVQPTSTARPILGKVPVGGRRNLLTWTEDFSNPVWLKTKQGGGLIPVVEATAVEGEWRVVFEATGSEPVDRSKLVHNTAPIGNVFAIDIKSNTLSDYHLLLHIGNSFAFRVTATQVWQRFIFYNPETATSPELRLQGNSASGMFADVTVRHPQFEIGSTATPYQRVTTAYDVTETGAPSVPHLIFDQVDDALTTATLPATADGSIAIAGRDGVWIGPLSHAGGNFTIGPATFNGGPRKLLKHLGGVLADGVRTIDRPITEAERKLLAAYYISKGSPKVFDRGSSWAGLDGLFSDAAGTIPATWGDPVAVIDDGSINDNEWVQGTSTARPRLGRVPVGGRRNLLRWTEDFTNSFWLKGNGASVIRELIGGVWFNKVIAADGVSASTGNTGSQVRTDHIPTVPGNRYAVRLLAKPAEFTVASIFVQEVEGFTVDLELLTTSRPDIVSVEGLGDGVVEIKFSGVPTRDDVKIRLGASGTGDGSSGIYYSEVQFERGEESTPYQKVDSEYDITEAGVPDAYYLRFDGVDDAVDTTLPAITKGTLVLAGTKGIWIDDDFNHAGGTFSIGPTSYTNGPIGLLPILGDLIVGGSFVIDRQLTTEERHRVVAKLKSMGAPGVFGFGPELMTQEALTSPSFVNEAISYSYNQTLGEATLVAIASVSYPSVRFNVLPVDGYILYSGTVDASSSTIRGFLTRGGTALSNRIVANSGSVVTSSRIEPIGSVSLEMTFDTNETPVGAVHRYRNLSARKLELIP